MENAASTNPSGAPSISPCDSGHSSMVSDRPGSASGRLRSPRRRAAEPVSRNRPARGSRSTRFLIASHRSGTRCTSSMSNKAEWRTNRTASSIAAARVPGRRGTGRHRRWPAVGPPLPTCFADLSGAVDDHDAGVGERLEHQVSGTPREIVRRRAHDVSLVYDLGSAGCSPLDLPTSEASIRRSGLAWSGRRDAGIAVQQEPECMVQVEYGALRPWWHQILGAGQEPADPGCVGGEERLTGR